MQNSVRKTFPLAIALLLALCGAAVAGDNANVVISLDGEHAAADAGEQVQVPLSAAGMVGVKQVEIILTVLPADAFDLAATTFTPAFGFSPGSGVELLGDDQIKGGVASLGEAVDGDGALGVFTLTMSSSFTRDSPAEIVVSSVSLGSSSVDRDVLGVDGLFIVNWAVPPPNMLATSELTLNPAYSSVGTGAAADGSPGEIEFSVNFTDDGAPSKGQTIAWDITNTGSRSVYLLGVGEVPSGVYVCLRNVTDGDGNAAVQFDAEGNLKAAATSLDVRARTTAVNPAGDTIDLAVDFNATWAVPDPDQLMFVSQVSLNNDDKALNELVAGPGAKIPVVLSAAGLAGVKQVEAIVTVSPADAFDLEATTFSGSSAFILSAPGVEVSGNQVRGGAVVLSNAVDGDEDLGTFTLVTSDNFTEEMEAEIVVHSVSLGPSSGMRDYLDTELLSRSMHLNRPDPVLVATAPLVGNALTSGADVGAVDDDSPGEITYSVNFTNLWGQPGEGQLILWDVYNRSTEWVSVLGIGTIPPHGSAFVRNTTDTHGNSSIEVDADVVSFLSITASTATENAAGKALDLAIDFSAAWAAAKPLAALPLANSLSQNYPNPFNPETTIPYALSSDAIVSLTIYNIAGQVVRKLVDGEALAAGQYQAVWDGRSESGASVASGMYFYLLHAGDYVAKRKMVLLR
ncbi:MAG: T9SS type A sorting domain-containing protein [Gemmatimonadetes bacterium]|nr:T9SS type A sorting domain-containing protein [Gemmatimonadota bacterium]MYC70934.1 T9SS type A sorting domain-containing protein [Gemmatimonadota bacterium]